MHLALTLFIVKLHALPMNDYKFSWSWPSTLISQEFKWVIIMCYPHKFPPTPLGIWNLRVQGGERVMYFRIFIRTWAMSLMELLYFDKHNCMQLCWSYHYLMPFNISNLSYLFVLIYFQPHIHNMVSNLVDRGFNSILSQFTLA